MGKCETVAPEHTPHEDSARQLDTKTGLHVKGDSTPKSTFELLPTERWLVVAIAQIGFGRIEFLQIRDGQIVVDPPPVAIRDIKFAANKFDLDMSTAESRFKRQLTELLQYIRGVRTGEIRTLLIRHGLPFEMEIQVTLGIGT